MWKFIETYIKDHRKEIDLDEPSPAVWKNIERSVSPTRKLNSKWAPYYKVAAVIIAVFGAGYFWLIHPQQGGIPSLASGLPALHMLESHPDWEEAERYYVLEYEKVREELEEYPWKQYDFSPTYMDRLSKLEFEFIDQVHSIQDTQDQEPIIKEMILNYEQRIQLLREWKEEIQSLPGATSPSP